MIFILDTIDKLRVMVIILWCYIDHNGSNDTQNKRVVNDDALLN